MARFTLDSVGDNGGIDTIPSAANATDLYVVVNETGSAIKMNVNANNAAVTVSIGDEDTTGVLRREFTIDRNSHVVVTVVNTAGAAHSWNINDFSTAHGTSATDGDFIYVQELDTGVTLADVDSD